MSSTRAHARVHARARAQTQSASLFGSTEKVRVRDYWTMLSFDCRYACPTLPMAGGRRGEYIVLFVVIP